MIIRWVGINISDSKRKNTYKCLLLEGAAELWEVWRVQVPVGNFASVNTLHVQGSWNRFLSCFASVCLCRLRFSRRPLLPAANSQLRQAAVACEPTPQVYTMALHSAVDVLTKMLFTICFFLFIYLFLPASCTLLLKHAATGWNNPSPWNLKMAVRIRKGHRHLRRALEY